MARRDPFIHPTVMFRKSFFQEVGLYNGDPGYNYIEDTELWARAIAAKKQMANLGEFHYQFLITGGTFCRRQTPRLPLCSLRGVVAFSALLAGRIAAPLLLLALRRLPSQTASPLGVCDCSIGCDKRDGWVEYSAFQHFFDRKATFVQVHPSYSGRRVIVTGAGGFIGSHLVEALLEQGARVRAMLRYTSRPDRGNLEFLPADAMRQIEIIRGDIRDPHFMLHACENQEIVFHLAALIAIPYSYIAPSEYVTTNVTGTLNVLESARRNNCCASSTRARAKHMALPSFARLTKRIRWLANRPIPPAKLGPTSLPRVFSAVSACPS